ncbi:MAG: peroxidase family protein [Planctomycetota bacterium]
MYAHGTSPCLEPRRIRSFVLAAMLTGCILQFPCPAFAQRNRNDRIDDHFSRRLDDRHERRRRGVEPVNPQTNHFRTVDGTQNNLASPTWGAAHVNLWRRAPAAYADGLSEPSLSDGPGPREISNRIFAQTESITNDRNLTDMVWQWGQFLDHDIDLTETQIPLEAFPIDVPPGDFWFDPAFVGNQQIFLFRSAYNVSTGITGPRQQINFITSWIDGSNLYGSDEETLNTLRHFRRGLMKVSAHETGHMLPEDDDGFYLAGDVRANEQVYLTAMHTLWMREHNRVARQLLAANPAMSDEQVFQHARKRVVATMQAITYNEFLPAILGDNAIRRYRGYRESTFPNIANVFSTGAYRFGHSMLSSELLRLDADGTPVAGGNLSLADAFFNPDELREYGIDPYLRGLISQRAQEIDSQVVSDVRNFLFGPPGAGGFDLVSLNIQRGRDHGLPSLPVVRAAYGLPAINDFSDITIDPFVQSELESLYGNVENVDPWVGMLCEDHMPGASVGMTAQRVMRDQFERLRDGDRFWYEREFSGAAREAISDTTLSNVIRRNTSIRPIRRDVFRLPGG